MNLLNLADYSTTITLSEESASIFTVFSIISFLFSFLIPFIFIIVIVVIIIKSIRNVKNKYNQVTNTIWGTNNLSEIVSKNDAEIRETPKSVSAMTSVYLPILQKDFPDLNWDEFKNKAVTELKKQLSNTYDSFTIHRTELYRYIKSHGTCTVILQSSVEYFSGGLKNQTRYNTHMSYVQDISKADEESSYSTTCPNCGAPITNLGTMRCEYCDSIVTPVNMKVWRFLKAEEV